MGKINNDTLLSHAANGNLQHIIAQQMIVQALNTQLNRYSRSVNGNVHNSDISSKDVTKHIELTESVRDLLAKATDRLRLSVRGYFKVIKIARTITEIDGHAIIQPAHIAKTLQYRMQVK